MLKALKRGHRFFDVDLKLQVDLHLQQLAHHLVLSLLLGVGVRESELYLHKRVVVELVPDEHPQDDDQFLQQFLLHEAILLAELHQFLRLVVGVNEAALVVLDLVDGAPDLDDFQGRQCKLLILFELGQLSMEQLLLPVALVPEHPPNLVV